MRSYRNHRPVAACWRCWGQYPVLELMAEVGISGQRQLCPNRKQQRLHRKGLSARSCGRDSVPAVSPATCATFPAVSAYCGAHCPPIQSRAWPRSIRRHLRIHRSFSLSVGTKANQINDFQGNSSSAPHMPAGLAPPVGGNSMACEKCGKTGL
jgi:hypothetical protein